MSHCKPRTETRLRIGAIGSEIGASHASTRCFDYGRRRDGVVVMVDNDGVCWAMKAGTPSAAIAIEYCTPQIVGTFVPGSDRGILTEIRAGIVERMREIGAIGLAA